MTTVSPSHRERNQDLRISAAEVLAFKDYNEIVGKIIFPNWVMAYTELDNTFDFNLNGKIPFRVSENQMPTDIAHWNDCWLDPYWDLQEVHPGETLAYLKTVSKFPPKQVRSFWTHGFSYHVPLPGKPVEEDKTVILTLKPWWKRIFSKVKTMELVPSSRTVPLDDED